MTAYCALLECTRMKAGDTVVISASAGSVGTDRRPDREARRVLRGRVHELGTEDRVVPRSGLRRVINYRSENDLGAALRKVCPKGVDVFIDNTAGPIHEAVMQNLATNARVALVGSISLAARFGQPDIGPRFQRQILIARATIKGFLVSDYQQYHAEARQRIGAWLKAGLMKSKFDVRRRLRESAACFSETAHEREYRQADRQFAEEPT